MSIEKLYTGKWLELVRDGRWEYVKRTREVQAVCLATLTENQELILIEQYRPAVQSRIIELPAGLVGDEVKGEDPLVAASRELMEETGYDSQTIKTVCFGPTSAGLSDEMLTYAIALGAAKKGSGGGVDGEDISVHVIPFNQIDDWLQTKIQEGVMVSPRIYTGLYWLNKHLAGGSPNKAVSSND